MKRGILCGASERGTEGVLKEFLARYGKVLDPEKELRRLGKMHAESAAAIVIDYGLPLTAEEFSEKIIPMYQERQFLIRTFLFLLISLFLFFIELPSCLHARRTPELPPFYFLVSLIPVK